MRNFLHRRPRARRIAPVLTALVATALVIPVLAGAAAAPPAANKDKLPAGKGSVSSMTWNVTPQPTNLDAGGTPQASQTISALLCDRLLVNGPGFSQVQPNLATSVKWTNATTVVLTIRQGVKYWDGTPLTTADVVWNLQRVKDNVNNVGFSALSRWNLTTSIAQTGPSKITIHLKKHQNTFQNVFFGSISEIQEPAYVQAKGTANATATGGLMCSGPYMLTSWKPGDSIVVTKNPNYWNKAFKGGPQTITFKFISDSNAIAAALQSGEIDGMYDPPGSILQRLEGSGAGKLYAGKSVNFDGILVTSFSGALADPRIRAALSMAIDRPAIARTVYNGFVRPNVMAYSSPSTFPGPQLSIYRTQLYKPLSYLLKPNLAKAKALVGQAGAPSSPITLYFQAGIATYLQVATIIQQEAQQIGLNVQLVPKDGASLNSIMLNDPAAHKGVDLWLRTNLQNLPPDPLGLILSGYIPGEVFNNGYSNAAWQAAVNAAALTTDPNKEAALVAKAIKLATNDGETIPLVYNISTLYLNKRLTGAWLNNAWFGPWATAIGASS